MTARVDEDGPRRRQNRCITSALCSACLKVIVWMSEAVARPPTANSNPL
jgi:hypothetical protein